MNLPAYRPSQTLAAYLPNPFNTEGLVPFVMEPGETPREFLERSGLMAELLVQPTMTILNGRPLYEADWDVPINRGDLLHLQVLPEAFVFNPAFWKAVYTVIQVAAVAVAIYGLATLPSTPEALTNQSPNQNLQVRSNRARLGEAIPVLYGRMRVFPDLAAQPHIAYIFPDDQMVTMLYSVSQGEVDIDVATMAFEDTPLSSFRTVEYEIIPPGATSRLYPEDVATSSEVSDLQIEQGTTTAYVTNPPATRISRFAVDVAFPRGLYRQRSSGARDRLTVDYAIEYQEIDDLDNAVGAFVVLPLTVSGDGVATIRHSHEVTVPPGRYRVRLNRTSPFDEESMLVNFMNWSQLRGFFVDNLPVTTTTRVAVRIRASEELGTRALTRFNLVGQRRLSTYDPDTNTWGAPIVTRRFSHAVMDALHNEEYGGNRDDLHINLAELVTLGEQLDADGFEVNGIQDTTITLWDMVTRMGNAAHCVPVDEGGVYTMLRDEPKSVAVQMFNMRNIVDASFSIEHIAPLSESKDHVLVEYFDRDQDYRPVTIPCTLPDGTSDDPQEVKLWGVDNRAQATALGLRIAAVDRYRREPVTLIAPLEGQIPRWGELIRVSHVVFDQAGAPQKSGDILSRTGSVLTLSESDLLGAFTNPHIVIPNIRNEPLGPYPVLITAADQVQIQGAFDASGLVFDPDHDNPRFQIGQGTDFDENVRVLALEPREGETIELSGFIDAPEVYTPLTAPPPPTLADALKLVPRVFNLRAELDRVDGQLQVLLSWRGEFSDRYDVEYSLDGGATWIDMGADRPQEFLVDHPSHPPGPIKYRVGGVSVFPGPFTEVEIDTSGLVGGPTTPAAPNKLNVNALGEGVELTVCVPGTGAIPDSIEIWRGVTNSSGSAAVIASLPAVYNPATDEYVALKVDGNVVGEQTYYYFARSRAGGNLSALFPTSGVPVTPPAPGAGPKGDPGASPVSWDTPGPHVWMLQQDGTWKSPDGDNQLVKDLLLKARRGGVAAAIAEHAIRATLNATNGTINVTDLPASEQGENTNIAAVRGQGSITVEVDMLHVSEGVTVTAVFTSSREGRDGLDALPRNSRWGQGRSTIHLVANRQASGAANDGEIMFSSGRFTAVLGDGSEVTRDIPADAALHTPWEGAYTPPDERGFIVWSPVNSLTAHPTMSYPNQFPWVSGFHPAEHENGQWYAVNNNGQRIAFMFTEDHQIYSTVFKAADSLRIDALSVHVPNVADGVGVEVQFSANLTGPWSDTFNGTTHVYQRQRRGTAPYSAPYRIVGENGSNGDYFDVRFRRTTSFPDTPTGNDPAGWSDAPPAATADKFNLLYMSRVRRDENDNIIAAWSAPVLLQGRPGADGVAGSQIDRVAANLNNNGGASLNFAAAGQDVLITLKGGATGGWTQASSASSATFTVRRDGIDIGTGLVSNIQRVVDPELNVGQWSASAPIDIEIIDSPAAGNHVYSVVWSQAGNYLFNFAKPVLTAEQIA